MNDKLIQVDGKVYIKSKVVRLATDKASNLSKYTKTGVLSCSTKLYPPNVNGAWENQHLYFLSDEDIKEGDWFIQMDGGNRKPILRKYVDEKEYHTNRFSDHYYPYPNTNTHFPKGCYKIIATTDEFLALPRPSNEFIQKFCELGGVDKVLVECEIRSNAALGHNEYVYLQYIEANRFIPIRIDANIYQDSYQLGLEETFEDYELECKLKVAPDNTITIKPLKVKDSWNRDEVEEIINKLFHDIQSTSAYTFSLNKWKEKNLK